MTTLPLGSRTAAHPASVVRQGLPAHLPELRGRALRLSRNAVQADDIVQDTVERALRFEAQFIVGTNLRAWLHQILFSVFVTRFRKSRRERKALAGLGADPAAWTTEDRFAPIDAALPLTSATEASLESLPEAFSSTIRLVDLGEMSYREAADVLDIPVGTVMSRLHRGRKLLRDDLVAHDRNLAA